MANPVKEYTQAVKDNLKGLKKAIKDGDVEAAENFHHELDDAFDTLDELSDEGEPGAVKALDSVYDEVHKALNDFENQPDDWYEEKGGADAQDEYGAEFDPDEDDAPYYPDPLASAEKAKAVFEKALEDGDPDKAREAQDEMSNIVRGLSDRVDPDVVEKVYDIGEGVEESVPEGFYDKGKTDDAADEDDYDDSAQEEAEIKEAKKEYTRLKKAIDAGKGEEEITELFDDLDATLMSIKEGQGTSMHDELMEDFDDYIDKYYDLEDKWADEGDDEGAPKAPPKKKTDEEQINDAMSGLKAAMEEGNHKEASSRYDEIIDIIDEADDDSADILDEMSDEITTEFDMWDDKIRNPKSYEKKAAKDKSFDESSRRNKKGGLTRAKPAGKKTGPPSKAAAKKQMVKKMAGSQKAIKTSKSGARYYETPSGNKVYVKK